MYERIEAPIAWSHPILKNVFKSKSQTKIAIKLYKNLPENNPNTREPSKDTINDKIKLLLPPVILTASIITIADTIQATINGV